jgi:prefoldin subunit 5|tara:strand:+ start:1641 stop:1811 length:171 start_codon:yes stop_codon:yes gene_type:complete
MKRKNYIQNKLESLEAVFTNLKRIVNTSAPREEYLNELKRAEGIRSEVESLIEQED